MSTDAEVACPDPNCPTRLRITRLGRSAASVTPRQRPCRCRDGDVTPCRARRELRRAMRSRASSAAAGSSPAAMERRPRRRRSRTCIAFCRRRHHHLRLRRHLYRGRGADRRASARHYAQGAAREALAQLKVHTKFVPDLDILPRIDKSLCDGVIDQSLRRLRHGAARPRPISTGGTMTSPACVEARAVADRASSARQDQSHRRRRISTRPEAPRCSNAGVPLI